MLPNLSEEKLKEQMKTRKKITELNRDQMNTPQTQVLVLNCDVRTTPFDYGRARSQSKKLAEQCEWGSQSFV